MTSTEDKNASYYLRQICTCKPKSFLGLVLLLLVFYFLTIKTSGKYRDNSFDYLLFSQRWIPTACIQFVERPSPFSRRCTLPVNFKIWAIHGLWPTQKDHMEPFFCNSSLPFDLNALNPIVSDLRTYWPNIEGERDYFSLWKHEWEKHGTCAVQLDSLNTEVKYFSESLNLYKKYNIENVLKRYNILPSLSNGYYVSDLFNILQSGFRKIPQIHCIFESHTHQPYLSEIRMCFNKNLQLIDCSDVINRFGRAMELTNCPRDRVIIYPDTSAPPALGKGDLKDEKDFRLQLLDLLQLLKFVQWIIL